MTTSVGDKIGLTAPDVSGSNNTWGTELNSLFTRLDEFLYANREDRNLVVLGGGTIDWDETAGELSFTSDIEIHNHITANKNIITTAASPITLDAAHKVAYVQLDRKPGSDNSITSATVVAAGSLPNGVTDSDHGTFVLAYRTADGGVIIPWARRKLEDGEDFEFNRYSAGGGGGGKPTVYNDELSSDYVLLNTATTYTDTGLEIASVVLADGDVIQVNVEGGIYNNSTDNFSILTRIEAGGSTVFREWYKSIGASSLHRVPLSMSKRGTVGNGGSDIIAPGTYTFKLQADNNQGTSVDFQGGTDQACVMDILVWS